jgi:DNA-binding FrmR family transcriptional regulator
MVEDERYCVDILTQIRAVRAALKRVEEGVLKEHVQHCVAGALTANGAGAGQQKLDELFRVLGRYMD